MKKSSASASDGFVPAKASPYAAEHGLLTDYLGDEKSTLPADSVKLEKSVQVALLCAVLERMQFQKGKGKLDRRLSKLAQKVAGRKMSFSEPALEFAMTCAGPILAPKDPAHVQFEELDSPLPGVVPTLLDHVEGLARAKPLSPILLAGLATLHAAIKPMEYWGGNKKTVGRLEALVAQKKAGVLDEGEAWADAIREDIKQMSAAKRKHWQALLENAPRGTNANPTAKWKEQADKLLAAVGREEFAHQIEHWFGLVGVRAKERIQTRNATMLRALIWYASLLTGETVCRALANAVEGGLRKIAAGSLYASSISKACIAALEKMPGLEPIAQLSRLKHRVKSPWGLEEIEGAFTRAVERSGISRSEMEEIAVPTFGLNADGALRQDVGDYKAELRISGSREVDIHWFNRAGKELDEAPELPKTLAGEEKAVKHLATDIKKMLSAQRDRIENLLASQRTWNVRTWRARYLDHPLLAQMSRRLIWQFREGKKSASAIWRESKFVQSNGRPVDWISDETQVQLWHPLRAEAKDVKAWRHWLEEHEVTQPFKQAHREIYLLTHAERATRIYSNRFAAHILRQHQFKALCDQRGWQYQFQGKWDGSDFEAHRELPEWNLRVEYWTQPAGDDYADSGVALHVATDQVRFTKPDESVVELADVPPIVFSELMRDADLFVGVCSVGNDPAWVDTGTNRSPDYWQRWAFGDLNATAQTRHEVLSRLLPRLKIAKQCSLAERFLVVRGKLRTYKIHLGSANILMEPNDQYLCIVPDRKNSASDAKVLLPFEGDSTLAVILSKAFLLVDDKSIKDPIIVGQINTR